MDMHGWWYRFVALVLSFLISPLPALCQQAQQAGDVSNLIPAATRNGAEAHLKDAVLWNDLLKTDPSGRVRVTLKDGSTLSVGSASELKVIQHDATSQQTTLQILLGRLRAQVMRLTAPNSKFEVNTPHATLGVIGTDFHVEVTNDSTTVIVYSGIVRVTPLLAAGVAAAAGQAPATNVTAGHMVQVTSNNVGPVQVAPNSLIQASIANTLVAGSRAATTAAVAGSHVLRNVLIGVAAAAAGAAIGVAVAKNSSSGKGPSIPAQ